MRKSLQFLAVFLLVCINSNSRAVLIHRYSFTNGDSVAVDSVAGQNGTLENGASISSNAVQLDGSNDYVNLPGGLITGYTDISFEAWFTCSAGNGTWSRIWDFGDTNPSTGYGRYCMFFTPKSGSNTFRYAISDADPGFNHEQSIQTSPTATGVPVYVAVIHNGTTGEVGLYVNGGLAVSGTFSIPLSAINDVYSYLGRSTYNADPELEGSIDEFRIYDSLLTVEEIEQHYLDGPDVIRPCPIVIQETEGSTEVIEGSGTDDTYSIALSSQPDADVTITVDPDEQLDIGGGRGSPVVILFTPQGWSSPRIVTVSAYDDDVWETEPHTGIIRHFISSSDPDFNDVALPYVSVIVHDNECGAWGFFNSDFDFNCFVNFKDLALFALYWNSQFDKDNLEIFADDWLKTTQPYAADAEYGPVQDAPEPFFIESDELIGQIDEKTYGHFLEHIYHSVNGGLWGELVWNRSFEQYSGGIGAYWTSYGSGGTFSIVSTDPKNSAYCQRIVSTGAETGIQQMPFNITIQTYRGSLWARSDTQPSSLVVRLKDDSTTIQEQAITVSSSSWLEYPFTFTPEQSAEDATLQIGVSGTETVYLDQVSMMGQDANATGGYRPDLLQAIAELHPPCIRWPGGCFASLYLWKDGIGPQSQRYKYSAYMWDDQDINSYGTDEFLRMCEILGVEPIIVINTGILNSACGGTAQWKLPAEEYLQYSMDWVEYCNGDANTTSWGAVRAANGHPEPYNVKYWEIDNETWGVGATSYSATVNEFAPALKTVDPTIKIIACGSGGLGSQSWNQTVINNCADVIDYISIHHYEGSSGYQSGPAAFEAFIEALGDIIKASSNPDIRIDVSEWNLQTTDWRTGLYAGGLLNGFERQSDVFEIGGPALFLRHTSATGWDNAFINFDHTGWFPAPNYVVMKLWRNNYAPYRIGMSGPAGNLNAIATESADGNSIYFKVVNPTDQDIPVRLVIDDTFDVGGASLQLVAPGSLSARNTLENPNAVSSEARFVSLNNQTIRFTMPAISAGVVRLSRKE